ncbi:hypothetical protein [Caulobacter sp.]|uniref:hypothetical protein n=1 Tax=Caulobacter sp. TaxID=78 RepID=UPI003BAC8EA0
MLSIVLAATISTSQIGDLKAGTDIIADNAIGMAIDRDPGANATPHIRVLPCYKCEPKHEPDPAVVRELTVLDTAGKVIFNLQLSARETPRANKQTGLSFPADPALIAAMAQGKTPTFGDTSQRIVEIITLSSAREAPRTMGTSQSWSGAALISERDAGARHGEDSGALDVYYLKPKWAAFQVLSAYPGAIFGSPFGRRLNRSFPPTLAMSR